MSSTKRSLFSIAAVCLFVGFVVFYRVILADSKLLSWFSDYEEMGHTQQLLLDFTVALTVGVLFIVISHWMRISAIVVLLIGGILVGPSGLGIVRPDLLGDGLGAIVQLAVGLILFEGGLTLDPKGYREAAREIKGVLTFGVLITWLVTTGAIKLVFGDLPWSICFLAGGLIIVTGPTVIGPLLKRIRVRPRIHNILHWEGVLIDPVGVFVGLLCYEWITGPDGEAVSHFISRMAVGIAVGLVWGFGVSQIIKRGWIASERVNIAVLASAMANFVFADWLVHESGLLSVTISGMVIGLLDAPEVRKLKVYKAELIELLIGLLFVLLAANLDLRAFLQYGWGLVIIVLLVMLVVRPLNIFLSTMGTRLTFRERLFLSWIAPRGIVAASMASLFALNLSSQEGKAEAAYASFLEPFTYSVIAGTVIIQGFSAGLVGKLLGVLEPKPNGWLVVGAHQLGRQVARFLEKAGLPVVLVDTNVRSVQLARREGLLALQVNALTVDTDHYPQLYGIGNVLAITENAELNTLVCQRWQQEQPSAQLYKWTARSPGDDSEPASGVAGDIEVGKAIWDIVPYGNLKHIEEHGSEGFLYMQTIANAKIRHGERVLMCQDGEHVTPYLPEELDGPAKVLTYRPFAVRLNLKMQPGSIMISDADDMAGILRDMVDHLDDAAGQVDRDALYQTLAAQEQEYSSLIGYGVALPHTYSTNLKESVVLCAKPREPIRDVHSGENIQVVFLVLSPKDDSQGHVNALSEISRFIMDDQNRERLLEATDAHTLIELFFPDQRDTTEDSIINASGVIATEKVEDPD